MGRVNTIRNARIGCPKEALETRGCYVTLCRQHNLFREQFRDSDVNQQTAAHLEHFEIVLGRMTRCEVGSSVPF